MQLLYLQIQGYITHNINMLFNVLTVESVVWVFVKSPLLGHTCYKLDPKYRKLYEKVK